MFAPADHPGQEGRPLATTDRWLARAVKEVRLLGAAAPTNAAAERARLRAVYEAGGESLPRWEYTRSEHTALRKALGALARELDQGSALSRLYAARARELDEEAAAAEAVGTRAFGDRAARRFGRGAPAADALAAAWLELAPVAGGPTTRSDADEPGSLLGRMRAEVQARRLPFTVTTSKALTSLAAISTDTIWVAEDRRVTSADIERTLLHELLAHAAPRARAVGLSPGIFAIGTAKGGDDQEGLGLLYEERHGLLDVSRRRELAGRHTAVLRMREGAAFPEVVRQLAGSGFAIDHALRIAERAFRGSSGHSAGLGREIKYLDALLRVRAHLEAQPDDEAVLTSGLVALDAVAPLRSYVA